MNTFTLSAGTAGITGSLALLRIARLNLFLPQSDIVAIESKANVDPAAPGMRSVGWIVYAQRRWPAYCLSEELSLLFQVPAGRRACVLLASSDGYVGVLCDEVRTSQEPAGPAYAIPDAMRSPDTPILGVTGMDSGIACFSDGNRMAAHIERMVAR